MRIFWDLKNKRKKVLVEVYNDDVMGRRDDDLARTYYETLNQGFKHRERNELTEHTRKNLLSPREETKVT